MEYLFLDAVAWWLSIKWDSCFCCTSSPLSYDSVQLCWLFQILGLAVVLIFFVSVFLAELFARCFSLFWKGQFDIKSFIIELMPLIPIGVYLYRMFVKGFTIGCKYNSPDFSIPTRHFERYLGNNIFQTVFQTFLVTVADFFGVAHFVLFLLFLLRKLCAILQFHLFERSYLQLSWSGVFVSPATQNVEWAATRE